MKLPYFKWYPGDADGDEDFRAMTDAEIGFYIRCLNHSWLNNGLPADPKERALVLRSTQAYVKRMWERVGKRFEPSLDDPTRIVNRRQEIEREKAQTKSRRATDSVRTRYERRENVPLRTYESESDSGFKVLSKKTSLLDDFGIYQEAAADAKLEGSESDWEEAKFAWRRLDFEAKALAVKGLRERTTSGDYNDPAFRPLVHNYLKKKMWQRPIRASPVNASDRRLEEMLKKSREMGI